MIKKNKWLNGAIPALLIHCSIGSVYAWSLFANPLAQYFNTSPAIVQFAFSFAIFCLGISAAFGGGIVENRVKISARISTLCFCLGLVIAGLSIKYKSLLGVYLGYGCLMGIGLGIGYVSPVKTLMLWFKENKGLGTGIAITGFGFASAIASPIITFLLKNISIENTFYVLALIYFFPLLIASFLLKKPCKEETIKSDFKYKTLLKDPIFIKIWFIMFLNISCGLALISIASPILTEYKVAISLIGLIVGTMGIFNGFGRLVLSILSDKLKSRIDMYIIILIASVLICAGVFAFPNTITISISLFIISATYGCGFSCLPTLLSDIYGMKNISKVHGICLTSWAIAGLCGNQISSIIKSITNSYRPVYVIITALYIIALFLAFNIGKHLKEKNT